MKRLLALISVLVIMLGGIAYAQESPGADTANPPAMSTPTESIQGADEQATSSTPSAVKEQPAGSEEESEAEEGESEKPRKPSITFGPSIGMYAPVNSTVKDVFGDEWVRVGIRPLVTELHNRWRWMFDISYYSLDDREDAAELIPITVGMMRGYGSAGGTRSYLAANVGPFYGRVNSTTLGIYDKGWGFNANVTAGVIFDNRWMIEARYDWMDDFNGLDFSALSVSAAVKMFSMRF